MAATEWRTSPGRFARWDERVWLVLAEEAKEGVAAETGFVSILGFEGEAEAMFGIVRQVDREMAPPSAVIVPQMVIEVGRTYPGRYSCYAHAFITFL